MLMQVFRHAILDGGQAVQIANGCGKFAENGCKDDKDDRVDLWANEGSLLWTSQVMLG